MNHPLRQPLGIAHIGQERQLLIGADYSQLFIGPAVPSILPRPNLAAYLTEFGAILTGTVDGVAKDGETLEASFVAEAAFDKVTQTNSLFCHARPRPPPLEVLVERMTGLDVLGLDAGADKPTLQDDDLSQRLLKSITRSPDGRYSIDLPFKEGAELLPSNFAQAFGRLQATHRRLTDSEKKMYYGEFEKRKKEGVLEIVDGSQSPGTWKTSRMRFRPRLARPGS